jgi:dTDP-4-amino-4,6-dideoxygalactose transaminase
MTTLEADTTPHGGPDPVLFAAPEITDADIDAVTSVLRSGWITTGTECELLEQELASFCGADHVVAVSSCTAALDIAVAHLDLPPGARIGVPTWTFLSTALSAVHGGHQPVLLDVDPATLNLSAEALEQAIGDLDAVITVHFGGVPSDKEVHRLCAERGIPLIEDAAHALGAEDHRGPMAGRGTAGACFSFYATKNLTSGEGGALATDDEDLALFARSHRLHGMSRDAWARYRPDGPSGYDMLTPGIKANMPDLLATLARSQLTRFRDNQRRRRAIVERYRANLAGAGGLTFVPADADAGSADHLMVVLLPEGSVRAQVVARLRAEGIGTSVHFQPLHTFDWFRRHAGFGPGGTPVADEAMYRALSLPLHAGLRDDQVDRTCDRLVEALGS